MTNHARALEMASDWINKSDATIDPLFIVLAYLDLTAELDDTRGALVQQVAELAALTAAADGMANVLDVCILDAYIPHDYKAMRMEAKDNLTAYRKLKESKNNDNARS
jgi:hypothetical protein